MHTRDYDVAVKAVGKDDGLEDGQFEAIVSVFNTIDSYGDVVVPGAFTEDLEQWAASGDPLPVIWAHDWMDPFSHVGYSISATEDARGLKVKGQLDLDNPKALQVYRLLKGRRIKQFSFAFDVLEAGFGTRDDQEVYELRKLKVYEVGPCLIGVNQDTELLAVKAQALAKAQQKSGRVLSTKNFESLTAAHEAIGAVLASATPDDLSKSPAAPAAGQSEPSQQVEPPASDEGADGTKSEPAAKDSARRARALALARTA